MNTVSRRTLLRGTFAAAALAGAAPALAACGNNAGSGPAASSNAGVKLPAYIPLKNGPVPDLAPTADGVLAGFLKYPENPISVTSGTPGVSLDMQVVPASDYNDKLNALVAGSSLPDMVMIRGIQPNLPDLLKAEFANLSELLAGDVVKEYPLLANLPTVCWKTSSIWNNGIYGAPIPRATMGSVFYLRRPRRGQGPEPAAGQLRRV
jgi:putative aldouronate transport system substrate-binding protein